MGIYNEVVEHLRNVWERKMGKVLISLLFLDIAVLGSVYIGIYTGNKDPLIGLWRAAFVWGIFAAFLLFFATIVLALQKPKITEPATYPSERKPTPDTIKPSKRWLGESGRIYRWGNRILFIWILVIGIGVYIGMGIFLVKTGIYPAIQQVIVKGVDWSSPDSVGVIILPIIFGSFYLFVPFLFYKEYIESRAKRTKSTKTTRR